MVDNSTNIPSPGARLEIPEIISEISSMALMQASLFTPLRKAGPQNIAYEGLQENQNEIAYPAYKKYSQLSYNSIRRSYVVGLGWNGIDPTTPLPDLTERRKDRYTFTDFPSSLPKYKRKYIMTKRRVWDSVAKKSFNLEDLPNEVQTCIIHGALNSRDNFSEASCHNHDKEDLIVGHADSYPQGTSIIYADTVPVSYVAVNSVNRTIRRELLPLTPDFLAMRENLGPPTPKVH